MAQIEGLIQHASNLPLKWLIPAILGLYACILITRYLRDPLRSIPGPFWARFSRLWYFKGVAGAQFEKTNIELHRKYGPVVRIAPNYYSIDDPDAIKTIYGQGTKCVKGKWYIASKNPGSRIPDLFTDLNPDRHAAHRRIVSPLYSMTSLVAMEPHVVEATKVLMEKLEGCANSNAVINIRAWFQYFAFDAIALVTLGKRFGFLDTCEDNAGMIAALHTYLHYVSKVGVYNEFHDICIWLLTRFSNGGMLYLSDFMRVQVEEGQKELMNKKAESVRDESEENFLTRVLRLHAERPEKFTMEHVFTICGTNIGAGSDTTGVSLAAVVNCLIRNPEALKQLRTELDAAYATKKAGEYLTFQEAQKLPYLQACIKEGFRVHPPTGLPLVRTVGEGGATIAGTYFPEGTDVGVNIWVANYNKQIFGQDADEFRPERWLVSAERSAEMNRHIMTFGAGSRTCVGKNISLLEISVSLPEIVKRFDFKLVKPDEPLISENLWLVKQKNLNCSVSLRDSAQ